MSKRKNGSLKKEMQHNNNEYVPKWEHPKILLIDLEEKAEATLKEESFNVLSGSFGRPYKVPISDIFVPVILNEVELPNYTEQEIIIIDLEPPQAATKPKGEKLVSEGEINWWASCNRGIIDPRPRVMFNVRKAFDRILYRDGIFLVFANMRYSPKQILAKKPPGYGLREKEELIEDNWGFLSILGSDHLSVKSDHGKEISVIDHQSLMGQLLAEHVKGATFDCTVQISGYRSNIDDKMWQTIALNKYGIPVACRIIFEKTKGRIFILPQIKNKSDFVNNLIKTVLPELAPHLFPDFKVRAWVHNTPYELVEIQEFKNEIALIEKEANNKVEEIKQKIEIERSEKSYLHDLLTETGRPLVLAVKKTLDMLGFKSVIDVDTAEKETTANKREDLRVHDGAPILLVEVKGIAALPKDQAALQVWKYIAPRMRDWARTDIQGLSIINHQRNMPALERENKRPFREDILINAEEQNFGLLTTWDLYRLARSFIRNDWKHEYVKDIFYCSGRIGAIPTHYQYVGAIEKVWKGIGTAGVKIKKAAISLGDNIAIEHEVEYSEHEIESLQVDNVNVETAEIGMLAGIEVDTEYLKKGMRVFRIMPSRGA